MSALLSAAIAVLRASRHVANSRPPATIKTISVTIPTSTCVRAASADCCCANRSFASCSSDLRSRSWSCATSAAVYSTSTRKGAGAAGICSMMTAFRRSDAGFGCCAFTSAKLLGRAAPTNRRSVRLHVVRRVRVIEGLSVNTGPESDRPQELPTAAPTRQKQKGFSISAEPLCLPLVGPVGFEPTTNGLRDHLQTLRNAIIHWTPQGERRYTLGPSVRLAGGGWLGRRTRRRFKGFEPFPMVANQSPTQDDTRDDNAGGQACRDA